MILLLRITKQNGGRKIARKLRDWYPGAVYHIMHRGVRRKPIFEDEMDHQVLLQIIKTSLSKYNCWLHAYCLMTNHVHLLIVTGDIEIGKFMKYMSECYAIYYNHKYGYRGHVFESRYKSCLVKEDAYFLQTSRYIHLNPVKAQMLEGQPVISIIGLGDQAVKEAAERIQAAIDESGYVFPKKRVIISLAPSDKKKSGSHFDLAMAVGVLCQNGDIGVKKLPDYGFIGELSLDGRLRACRGILPMIIAGQKRGMKKIIVPEANLKEASLVHGVEILGFHDLTGVIRHLEGKSAGMETHIEEDGNILDEADRGVWREIFSVMWWDAMWAMNRTVCLRWRRSRKQQY